MEIKFTIEFYKKLNGKCPFREYLRQQTEKTENKILAYLHNLATLQSFRREPYTRRLKDKIRELKFEAEGNAHRILYFMIIGRRIIILNAFLKKGKKTPKGEIVRALTYMSDYLLRYK